jgi:hypothetical protein
MGFPDTWLIEPLKNTPGLVATWGKGITVDCGRWIGEWIHSALDGQPGTHRGAEIGTREFLIDVTNAWSQNLVQLDSTLKKFKKLLGGNIMTEPVEAPAVPVTEGETPTEGATEAPVANASGGGRPRPQATLERDAKVLEYLAQQTEGQSKDDIAKGTELPANEVYLSLWRLKRDGEIHKTSSGGAVRWVAGEAPANEAPAVTSDESAAAPVEESVAI